jgi:hypothetical protein
MRNYTDLCELYDRKFLNYIINRSKKINHKWNIDYEDLVGEGLLKLVEVYHRNKDTPDIQVMTSLVHLYNDINEKQKTAIHPMSLAEFV